MRAILSLPLFMLRIYADDPHHALAVDHLALVTNFLYRCAYLHTEYSLFLWRGRLLLTALSKPTVHSTSRLRNARNAPNTIRPSLPPSTCPARPSYRAC